MANIYKLPAVAGRQAVQLLHSDLKALQSHCGGHARIDAFMVGDLGIDALGCGCFRDRRLRADIFGCPELEGRC